MDGRRANIAKGAAQEDISQPTDGVEPGSEADAAVPPTEPNVVQLESEQPLSSPIAPTADAAGQPQ